MPHRDNRYKVLSLVRQNFLAGASVLLFLFFCSPSWSIDRDTQLWNTTFLNRKIDNKWSTLLEVQERWFGDLSYFSFLFLRPSITYTWNDRLTFTGGYAYVFNWNEDGDLLNENRIWEQVSVRLLGNSGEPYLNLRSRLEQRFIEDFQDPIWRVREQLRLTVPLVNRVDGVVWSEAFWRLNSTVRDNGTPINAGLEQLRSFVGLNLEITKAMNLEAGYINVYIWRPGIDRDDHVISLNTTLNF